MKKRLLIITFISGMIHSGFAQQKNDIAVIGYYAGRPTALDSFPIEKLTHIIYCFCHLSGNKLSVSRTADTLAIQKMVSLKQKYPALKVILSMGGWGGCRDCSSAFSTSAGRKEFAKSTREMMKYFGADGIDLDWEYPAIEGYPGHGYSPNDRTNFTALIRILRRKLRKKYEISFAAGGFDQFIDSSVEWKKVMKWTDKVNVMSYDLVSGFSTISGHHTPLYSTKTQKQSADNAINKMIAAGVPREKIIIGAAFYARMFQVTDSGNFGMYRTASFYHGVSYSHLYDSISAANGFTQYWDSVANAPYAFNPARMIQVTYDDSLSIARKTQYVIDKKLGGIMFWQLGEDRFSDGLLDVIDRVRKTKTPVNGKSTQ